MRILIADEFSKRHLDSLRGLGLTVDFQPNAKADDLPGLAKDAGILVVRSTEVKGPVFEAAKSLSLVIRAGAGVNTIDVAAASARGVYVANCPGQNAIAVAELTMGLMLAADRHIPENVAALHAGQWNKKKFSKANGVFGRTLGIVGVGAIGTAVGVRARAFGMRVVACSLDFSPAHAQALGFEHAETPLAVARQADVFSVHLPGGSATKGVISRAVLAALPDQALVINTARAEVIDQVALLDEAKAGRLRVALDVYADEPKSGEMAWISPLGQLPNVYGTHHIGASTEQAQEAIADETVRIAQSFLTKGEVPNCVNVAKKTDARFQLIVRHFDRVGVLANVLGELSRAGLNAQELENTIFEGSAAACCKIQIDRRPTDEVIQKIASRSDEVIFVDLVEL